MGSRNTPTRSLIAPALTLAMLPGSLSAQNWMVGTPVNEVLSHVYLFAGSCTPDPSHRITFPTSPVTGVEYAAIVTLAYPGDQIIMVPGPQAPLHSGDTIWIADPVAREVFYPAGGGNLNMEFRALGTPLVAGEAHPCAVNDSWISDLGICPETLSIALQNGCATAGSTAIEPSPTGAVADLIVVDGSALTVVDPSIKELQLFDARGRMTRSSVVSGRPPFRFMLDGEPSGVFTVRAVRRDGTVWSRRFVLAR